MAKQHESARELELSRALARLFGVLPYEMVNSIVLALYQIGVESEQELLNQIDTEQKLAKDERQRLDVVIPLSIESYKEIIFETKLGNENLSQVEGYAKTRKNSLVISLANSLETREAEKENIRRLTWEDFFWGMFYLLGIDAQKRLSPTKEEKSEIFIPDFPKRPLGFIAETYLEDFLRDLALKEYVRLSTGQRVLVVTGKFASETCIEHNMDIYGNKWDQLFDYICVVYQKKLKYVGKVEKKYTQIQFEENRIKDRNELYSSMTEEEEKIIIKAFKSIESGSSIAILEPVNIELDDLWTGINLGAEYARKGAITQSHRYFDTPKEFIEHFKKSK